MYGERGRIGLLVPSSNSTLEMDVHRLVPAGVSVHTARMYFLGAGTEGELRTMIEDYMDAALRNIATVDPDVVVLGCTAAGALGVEWEADVAQEMTERVGAPAFTVTQAVRKALDALGLRRLSVVTPYNETINAVVAGFLEQMGYGVRTVQGLGLTDNLDIGAQTPERIVAHAKDTLVSGSDGIFISCTNFRGVDAVQPLEETLGVPVVTSNQASAWWALRTLGVKTHPVAGGRLFGLREVVA